MNAPELSKEASSLILIRPTESNGFEVLLTRDSRATPLSQEEHCFPGDAVREEDYSATILRRCYGVTPAAARSILGAQLAPNRALGFWLAAIRELFTKAGILLVVDRYGHNPSVTPGFRARISKRHAALLAGTMSFESILEREDLFCDAASMAYFSHWLTPSELSAKLQTRFFIAALPDERQGDIPSCETYQGQWLTPDQGLQRFARRQLSLTFPAFAALRTLADYDSFHGVAREFGIKSRV